MHQHYHDIKRDKLSSFKGSGSRENFILYGKSLQASWLVFCGKSVAASRGNYFFLKKSMIKIRHVDDEMMWFC